MLRHPPRWAIGFVLFAIASDVFGSPAPMVQSAWQRKANPYSDLFQPSRPGKPNEQARATQPTPAQPTVVCGMTIIPADPSIDPKFTRVSPDRSTTFTMRVIEPTICKPVAR